MGASVFDPDEQLDGVLRQVAGQLKLTLGGVHGALEQLAPPDRRDGDPRLDREAAVLCQSYFRMMRLADNLAAAADIGSAAPELRNGDIVELCQEIAERVEPLAALLGLEVAFHCQKSGHIIAMNASYIQRLLLNLLSNAFQYTPHGGRVALEVSIEPEQVALRLSDTGCGIPPERLDTIFDRYRQVDRMEPPPHGLGLGLPLCLRIAQAHGGRIALRSQVGEGTTVEVSLPNKRARVQQLRTLTIDYAGGYDQTLLELSDALPWEAFTQKYLD